MIHIVLQNSLRALCLVPLTALCLVVAPAQAADTPQATPPTTMPAGSDMAKKPMMTGMGAKEHMQMSGNHDKDFATMMKMHHQHAIDMAQTELAKGKSPAMKAMATRIIAAQKKEIGQLEHWLANNK